jgi:hypothetical protein
LVPAQTKADILSISSDAPTSVRIFPTPRR